MRTNKPHIFAIGDIVGNPMLAHKAVPQGRLAAEVIAGKEDYEITEGSIILDDQNLEDLAPEERAHQGIFLSFQYPIEIPGVTVTNFIKTAINANRKAKGLEDLPAKDMLKVSRSGIA